MSSGFTMSDILPWQLKLSNTLFSNNILAEASLLLPQNFMATSTSTSIMLSWTQPYLEELIQNYVIAYTYAVRGCSSELNSRVTVFVNSSSRRNYTILNSPLTPIEEYSEFNISLVAVSSDGLQSDIVYTVIHTPQAGILQLHDMHGLGIRPVHTECTLST